MIDHHTFQGEDDLSGVGLPRAGLGAQTAVKAFPKFVGMLQDPFPRADLDVADHFAGEMFVEQRADGGTSAAVETGQSRIFAIFHHLLGKIRDER
ncbi:hypothetical protein DESC_290129 [Desulfosarcina cetonica]|nr:hypothetical protein DESC_290129 [Desulfosarcina cetonica]